MNKENIKRERLTRKEKRHLIATIIVSIVTAAVVTILRRV